MRLLLYCCKNKPYIDNRGNDITDYPDYVFTNEGINGKIVAECDYEIEEIKVKLQTNYYFYDYFTDTLQLDYLLENSCLSYHDLDIYLRAKYGYAIHVKNLHIFDEPKELNYYSRAKSIDGYSACWHCKRFGTGCKKCNIKAPQNMMYVFDGAKKKVLISIRPEWLCKILNGEKTIEVRKKVLKEMIK